MYATALFVARSLRAGNASAPKQLKLKSRNCSDFKSYHSNRIRMTDNINNITINDKSHSEHHDAAADMHLRSMSDDGGDESATSSSTGSGLLRASSGSKVAALARAATGQSTSPPVSPGRRSRTSSEPDAADMVRCS